MGRLSKEELARFSGANWLLEFAKNNGLDEAEKEVERRGIRNMPLKLKDSDVDVFVDNERKNILNCFVVITLGILKDEFDFENSDCKRFSERFNLRASCILEDYVSWKDLRDSIEAELGIRIPLPDELEEG